MKVITKEELLKCAEAERWRILIKIINGEYKYLDKN